MNARRRLRATANGVGKKLFVEPRLARARQADGDDDEAFRLHYMRGVAITAARGATSNENTNLIYLQDWRGVRARWSTKEWGDGRPKSRLTSPLALWSQNQAK